MVCASPLVDRPISASFDDQGRLYVTDSSGSNEKPDKQLEAKPHRVVRLEDNSNISLNTQSVLKVDYRKSVRRIEMRAGEALFKVEKDPRVTPLGRYI